jgi:hypothetical protein
MCILYNAHTAATDLLLGETETCEIMKQDIDQMPVSDKMKALLKIASLYKSKKPLPRSLNPSHI